MNKILHKKWQNPMMDTFKDDIIRYHHEDRWSIYKIAKHFRVSPTAIKNVLVKYDVELKYVTGIIPTNTIWKPWTDIEFVKYCNNFEFTRYSDRVTLEHEERLHIKDYKGAASISEIESRYRSDVKRRGQDAIPYNVLTSPDGKIWKTGNWNISHNTCSYKWRSQQAGPFIMGLVGDFTEGKKISEAQLDSTFLCMCYILYLMGRNINRQTIHFFREKDVKITLPDCINLKMAVDFANNKLARYILNLRGY